MFKSHMFHFLGKLFFVGMSLKIVWRHPPQKLSDIQENGKKSQFCLLFSHLFLNMISWSLRHAIHAKVEFIRVTVMLSSQAFYIEVVDLHYFSGFLAFFKTWPQKQCGTNSLASRLATLNFPSKKAPKWILNLQVADYRDGYGGRRGRNVWAVGRRHCGWIATKWSNAGFWSNG